MKLHIIALPASSQKLPHTVGMSSEAAREAVLPMEWREDWAGCCKIPAEVVAYGEFWGALRSEVILLRSSLPEARTVAVDAFSAELRQDLREHAFSVCADCSDQLEVASRNEALLLACHLGLFSNQP